MGTVGIFLSKPVSKVFDQVRPYCLVTPAAVGKMKMENNVIHAVEHKNQALLKLSETHADVYISYIHICLTKVLS